MAGYPRKDLTLRSGQVIAYRQVGDGPDVVLVHGALTTLDDMVLALAHPLAPHFRVTAFDRPGHGFSSAPRGPATPLQQAAALVEASDRLGLRRPVVVGHSFGGAVALGFGQAAPDALGGIVALAPIGLPEFRLEHLVFGPRAASLPGLLLNSILAASSDPVLLPALWRAMFLPQEMPIAYRRRIPFSLAAEAVRRGAEGEDALWLNVGLLAAAAGYRACRAPTRILGGSADLVVNNRLHGALVSAIMPAAHFTLLAGMGHMLHHFAPAAVEAAIREVLAAH